MKSIIKIVFAFLMLASNVLAAEVFEYNDALVIAKDTDRKVLVYFGAEWCDYCRKMQDVLRDKKVSSAIEEGRYLLVKIDVDKDTKLKRKFSVKSIPDVMVIDKNENVLKRYKGYKDKNEFILWLE